MGDRNWRALTVLGALAALTASATAGDYTVRLGDTLSAIAQRVGSSVRALVDANGLADPDRIVAGQLLALPTAAGTADQHHVVQPGETLSDIAARHAVAVADLAAANGITDPDRVLAGSRLAIADTPAGGIPAAAAASGRHVVQPGETLSDIAVQHGIGVADLAAANGITDPDRVLAGTPLAVPGGWWCPVQGPVAFSNDFGVVKPDDRIHEGVDLFSERGTPVVAPVPGRAEQVVGSRGGLQVWLRADDGDLYILSHLDGFGASGDVPAGTEVGTVGTSGNAAGTSPHVHFERHPGGDGPVNPYPLLVDHC